MEVMSIWIRDKSKRQATRPSKTTTTICFLISLIVRYRYGEYFCYQLEKFARAQGKICYPLEKKTCLGWTLFLIFPSFCLNHALTGVGVSILRWFSLSTSPNTITFCYCYHAFLLFPCFLDFLGWAFVHFQGVLSFQHVYMIWHCIVRHLISPPTY